MNGREGESVTHNVAQLLLVVGKTTTCTAKRKCGAKNYGVANLVSCLDTLLDRVGDVRGDNGLANAHTELLEELTVLSLLDRGERGTKNLDTALLQDALLGELYGEVKTCLTTKTRNDSVGALIADNLRYILQGERLHIYLVGNMGIGHNCCRVRVHEDYLITLLLECKTSLRTCVVKLGCLANNDRA